MVVKEVHPGDPQARRIALIVVAVVMVVGVTLIATAGRLRPGWLCPVRCLRISCGG